MRAAPVNSWLPFAPLPERRSPAAVSRSLQIMSDLVRGPHPPTMAVLWRSLMVETKEDNCWPLIMAGHDIAQRIDAGIDAGKDNAYHNAAHFKEVLLSAAALTEIAGWQGKPLTPLERTELLFSALIHDYGHDGGRNGGRPLHLENRSLEGVRPDLEIHEVAPQSLERICLMVRSTDVSQGTGFVNQALAGAPVTPPAGYEALAPLATPAHKRMGELAAMLRDADVLITASISFRTSQDQKVMLSREWNVVLAPDDQRKFLDFVVSQPTPQGPKHSFASQAGRFFNPRLAPILKKFEAAKLQ